MVEFEIELRGDGKFYFFIDGWTSNSSDPGDCISKLEEWLEEHTL